MTTTRTAADQLGDLATEQAGEIERLEAEHKRFRAQAEEHFRKLHERNMGLAGKVAALKNANYALTTSLKVANREIERLRGLS